MLHRVPARIPVFTVAVKLMLFCLHMASLLRMSLSTAETIEGYSVIVRTINQQASAAAGVSMGACGDGLRVLVDGFADQDGRQI